MSFFFWICFFLIVYTYFGYPAVLAIAAALFPKKVLKAPFEPSISVLLTVYNEEKFIEKKLVNLLHMNYPEEKLEIIVGSDGSIDETDTIVSRFRSPRIRFMRFVKNLGKPHVLSNLAKEANGTILVLTDARQELERDAIKELVQNFSDPKVGSVSGELFFRTEQQAPIGQGMGAYWAYEKFLRRKESEIGSMLGATGALYAVRRHLFPDMPCDILVDDMYIPLSIVQKGFRAVFDPSAKAYDIPSLKGKQEIKRKIRTLAGNYQIFNAFPELLNPQKSPIAIQMISHKFLRLVIPFLLLGIFLSNIFLLAVPFYRCFFVLQVLFYMTAFVEGLQEEADSNQPRGIFRKIGFIAYTFCVLNYSALMAFLQYIRGDYKAAWEKAYV